MINQNSFTGAFKVRLPRGGHCLLSVKRFSWEYNYLLWSWHLHRTAHSHVSSQHIARQKLHTHLRAQLPSKGGHLQYLEARWFGDEIRNIVSNVIKGRAYFYRHCFDHDQVFRKRRFGVSRAGTAKHFTLKNMGLLVASVIQDYRTTSWCGTMYQSARLPELLSRRKSHPAKSP